MTYDLIVIGAGPGDVLSDNMDLFKKDLPEIAGKMVA
jgi:hypothetical protein